MELQTQADLLTPTPGAEHTGVMAAYWLPSDLAQRLALPDGEPAEELHITIVYLGDADQFKPEQIASVIRAVDQATACSPVLTGKINGLGRFNASEASGGQDVIYAVVDVPKLETLRTRICEYLTYGPPGSDIDLDFSHGFNPHVTLAYVDPGAPWPIEKLESQPVIIDRLSVVVGDKRAEFRLGREFGQAAFNVKVGGSQVTRRKRQGRSYLVAPAVAIVEGVMNSDLVLSEEFGKFPGAWNGIPLVINHPKDADGNYISANAPDLPTVGQFFGAYVEDDKLHGETWFDEALLADAGEDGEAIRTMLEAGEVIEVSTAYWREREPVTGVFNGKAYEHIARHIRPDHLAVLLDSVGACSVNDGCGVPRTNSEKDTMSDQNNDVIQDVPQPGEETGGVQSNQNQNPEEDAMDRKKLIEQLAANARCPLDAEQLEPLTDEALQAMQEAFDADPAVEGEGEGSDEGAETGAETPATPATNKVVEERIAALETQVAEAKQLASTLQEKVEAAERASKQALISEVAANAGIEADVLAGMPAETLERLASAMRPGDYSGRGGSMSHNAGDGEYVVEMPVGF